MKRPSPRRRGSPRGPLAAHQHPFSATNDMQLEIIVCDRREIEAGLPMRVPFVLISISDPGTRLPRPRVSALCMARLFLRFHDAEPSAIFPLPPEIKLMTPADARAIWKFVFKWKDAVKAIVVHCEAGMSRSPAIAAALCQHFTGKADRFFQDYQPNGFVFETTWRVGLSEKS